MDTRKLGSQGFTSSAIALGCMAMSGTYGPADDRESIATIQRAIDQGVTVLDTGDYYGMGHNELLIREAIRGRRERVLLSVKFGALRDHTGNYLGVDCRPAAIRNFIAYSLTRLGVDAIDFYYPGRVDPAVPIEDTIGALAQLVKEGKVRWVGLSEAGAKTLERAHAVHPISALQIEYSLFSRDIESEVLPTARRLGIGIQGYGAFSRGLFTASDAGPVNGSGPDIRRHMPRFQGENLARNLRIKAGLEAFARQKGCTVPQLCVAWVLAQGADIVPVIGTKRRQKLDEDLGALNVRLTLAERAELERIVPKGAVAGDRYPAQAMASVGR
jgi:aryl-alcohol dehydrogenase-like predicted oxidoreductase